MSRCVRDLWHLISESRQAHDSSEDEQANNCDDHGQVTSALSQSMG